MTRTPAANLPIFRRALQNLAPVLLGLSLASGVAGCVTVNVNLPESAVQSATDDYVRDLYRAKEKKPAASPAQPAAEAAPKAGLFSLMPEALADTGFRIAGEKAEKIRTALAGNLDEILAQKRAGVLGESNAGLLTLQSPEKLKRLLMKKVGDLVNSENALREELYAEVLKSNGLEKARLMDIKKSFARSFQAESPSGTWVQDPDGKWSQKP